MNTYYTTRDFEFRRGTAGKRGNEVKLIIALLLCTVASGQSLNTVPTKPLVCKKYQHLEPEHIGCTSNGTIATSCDWVIPAGCVDDVHWLTEREWQELMARIKKLEAKKKENEGSNDRR